MTNDPAGKELADIISAAKPLHPSIKWIAGALLLLLLVAVAWWYFRSPREEDAGPVYETEELTRGDLSLSITATGNLAPTNQVTVGSELSGTVSEVYVNINDKVTKGQPVAQLDTSKLTQQTEKNKAILLAAESRVQQVEATLAETSASLARLQELHRLSEGKTPSKADMDASIAAVDRAKADLASAKASVAQSQADLKSIERDLSKAIIRSPVDGIVLTRSIEVGQTVAASFTAPVLFLIAEDLRKMDLLVAVAEADIGRVAVGQEASFTVSAWPSRTYTASVKRVAFGSAVTNNVVTYNTQLGVSNDDLSLRPGMTATTEISVAKADKALLVPNAALRFDPVVAEEFSRSSKSDKTFAQSLSPMSSRRWRSGPPAPKTSEHSNGSRVWCLKDGKPVEIPVRPGLTDGRMTEVTGDGLVEGMAIIVTAKPTATP